MSYTVESVTAIQTVRASLPEGMYEKIMAEVVCQVLGAFAEKLRAGRRLPLYQYYTRAPRRLGEGRAVSLRLQHPGQCAVTGEWLSPKPGGTFAVWLPGRKRIVSEAAWKALTPREIRAFVGDSPKHFGR